MSHLLHPRPRRARRGVSLIEILVAMTLLVVVLGSLSVLTTRTVRRSRDLDLGAARTFVIVEEANRFDALGYNAIPSVANLCSGPPRMDQIVVGRFTYSRRACYTQSTTGSQYRTLKVVLVPLADTVHRDSLMFQRAMTYASSPLFQTPP
jgi:prepilin-type N-terminal cleavage/methylation domain-containing protein